MNAQKILSQLMKQAARSSSKKHTAGDSGFNVSSLLGSGALGMLLGGRRGRSSIKYAALAGLGKMAWQAWQKHRSESSSTAGEGEPLEQLDAQAREQRSRVILKAMIAAARADGHIDEREQDMLAGQMRELGADDELQAWVEQQMASRLDASAIARDVDTPQAAREVYLASVAIIDEQNDMERAWLDQLGRALGLEAGVCTALEREAQAQ
ncbi:tellurite resistance TerB family protein [Larsenimonas rhizosphaerae]|uniref:Tellurite resistance TerB family protein n=1 Tax=Larsenimonas rhizosphaerae TaxID=2944682 RepID=A0AA41ZGH6_9GAMM|nr:tellurite resistance TerB family protein [Larsenimonas rhizosphaerae]MCM2129439.1 tellurite resistance TerB family protein [Larsenimonas rhizosphaerae]MCX2524095.1 tellurite resistance TerB family protein [Larsenimonas rhizosphaerae]